MKCPICKDDLKEPSVTINSMCVGCARDTYIIYRDIIVKKQPNKEGKCDIH